MLFTLGRVISTAAPERRGEESQPGPNCLCLSSLPIAERTNVPWMNENLCGHGSITADYCPNDPRLTLTKPNLN